MKKSTVVILLTVAMLILPAAAALAGGSAEKAQQYDTVAGVLSIKEGHGEFLVRLPDGKAQRFNLNLAGGAEITRNGKSARYSELKPSDSIEVKYDPTNRKVIAIHASGA
jgi:hypothetical protein